MDKKKGVGYRVAAQLKMYNKSNLSTCSPNDILLFHAYTAALDSLTGFRSAHLVLAARYICSPAAASRGRTAHLADQVSLLCCTLLCGTPLATFFRRPAGHTVCPLRHPATLSYLAVIIDAVQIHDF